LMPTEADLSSEPMPTVDANCWIATFDPTDPFHAPSTEFFQRISDRALLMYGPEFVVLEVACAVARRLRDPIRGEQAAEALWAHAGLRFYPHDEDLLREALRLGTQQFLRGADALYAATAALTGAQLISWDNELVRRAGALTPTAWLDANP
jgi:predicted nucleic acid-binding protein